MRQIDIAHRVSEKERNSAYISLFNRKADRTNFYKQKKKLLKVGAFIIKPNNEDHGDREVSFPSLERKNSYIYMNTST